MLPGQPNTLEAAVEAARLARDQLAAAAESGGVDRKPFARAFFGALERLLKLYAAPENWRGDTPLNHLPPDIILNLSRLCGYLAVGKIPEPMADCQGAGQSKPGPTERRDIEIAVAYIRAAKAGIFQDRAPTQSVAAAYDVKRRTVQDWSASMPEIDAASVASGHPELLPSLMRQAARRYRHAGRSFSAIGRRAKGG